jgi:hypothetical protein
MALSSAGGNESTAKALRRSDTPSPRTFSSTSYDVEEGINVKAALCVAFAAFLRSGEFIWVSTRIRAHSPNPPPQRPTPTLISLASTVTPAPKSKLCLPYATFTWACRDFQRYVTHSIVDYKEWRDTCQPRFTKIR